MEEITWKNKHVLINAIKIKTMIYMDRYGVKLNHIFKGKKQSGGKVYL